MGSKPVVSLPATRAFPCNQRGRRAIIVSPVAIIVRPVAMIVGATRQIPCNDSGRKPPMIAIPDPDDCSSLQILTPYQIKEARQRIAKGERTREVAKVFNVSVSTISRRAG